MSVIAIDQTGKSWTIPEPGDAWGQNETDLLVYLVENSIVDADIISQIATDSGTTNISGISPVTLSGGNNVTTSATTSEVTVDGVNIWNTFTADTGLTTPDISLDTLNLQGGTNISTAITGDTVSFEGVPIWSELRGDSGITAGPTLALDTLEFIGGTNISTGVTGGSVQFNGVNIWNTISADIGSVQPSTPLDVLTITGGSSLETSISGNTLTVQFTGGSSNPPSIAEVVSDTGTFGANISGDSLSILGGTGIATSISGDVVTITNTDPGPDVFNTIAGDTGSATANTTNDTFNIIGGTNVSTSVSGDTLTIDTSPNQDVFTTIQGDTGSTTADSLTDTLTVTGGTNITTSIVGDVLTIVGSPNQDLWSTFTADTGTTTADTTTDTLIVSGGTDISTSISGDTLTLDFTNTTGYITDVVQDTTPQLGGNLDLNGNEVVNTSGSIVLDGVGYPSSTSVTGGDILVVDIADNLQGRQLTGGTGVAVSIPSNIQIDLTNTFWETVVGDTGSSAASIIGGTLNLVTSGNYVDTAVTADTVTINTDFPLLSNGQLFFGDGTGNLVARSIVAGPGIDTNISSNFTISNTSDIFNSVVSDSGTATASGLTDTLSIVGGSDITTSVTGNTLTVDVALRESFSLFVEQTVGNSTYVLDLNTISGFALDSVTHRTRVGTCDISILDDGVGVGGFSAIGVNTTKSTTTGGQNVNAGSVLEIQVSNANSCEDLAVTLEGTRI